jgi:hypothetical protein
MTAGDRVSSGRRAWGTIWRPRRQHVGDNGDIVEVLGRIAEGLRGRTKAEVE